MISCAVAFALLLHAAFWGAGTALLLMPARWRRFWPLLVFPAGFALQSVVVWLGAWGGLRGTNSYAWAGELLPLGLLVAGLRRRGGREAWSDIGRVGLAWLAVAGSLLALVLPLAIASRGLTTVSLGSCDAADYAAGARVLMEFPRAERGGFIGLTDVVRVMSVDNFYDFWLRLNHFTPSALMALNGSALDCAPHEIAGILTMVVLASTVPVVFWVARALFGYSGAASLVVAAIYGVSPITWYSVAHVSPAPLLAAQAIALLTWAGVALWNGRLTWRLGGHMAGVLTVAYVLLMGSYSFIVIVAFAPLVAYVGKDILGGAAGRRLARWFLLLVVPLIGCGAVFGTRVAGLGERLMLFRMYDFGWRIPALTPEGWLGMVRGGDLQPWTWAGLRWLLAAVVLVVLVWAVVRAAWSGRKRVAVVFSVTAPVLIGYAFLQARGAWLGTNASYDAFKLFAVFYPLLLPAFCWWATLRWSSRLIDWLAVGGIAALVIAFNAVGCGMFVFKLSRPPLIVDGELRQLRRIESMPDVRSVNLLVPDMWSRLWANAFLLRKPQYFATHTYEGRLNTPLGGEWDLVGDVVRVQLGPSATRAVTPRYWLSDTRAPAFVRVALLNGWHAEERLPDGERWRWTAGDARLRITNPHDRPLLLGFRLDGRAAAARDITMALNGREADATFVPIGEQRRSWDLPAVAIPPGESVLVMHSRQPGRRIGEDARLLGVCVFSLTIEPRVSE